MAYDKQRSTGRGGKPGGYGSTGGAQGSGYGKRPYTKRENTEGQSYDKKPYGSKPYTKRENTEGQSYDKKPYGSKPYTKRENTEGQSYDKKPYGSKPYTKRENTEGQSYDKKPYGSKPYDKKPYTKRDAFERPRSADARVEAPAAPTDTDDDNVLPFLIIGRNAVREAVKNGRSIDYILSVKEPDGSLREILGMARDQKIIIREYDRKKLDEITMPFGHGGKPANHQGVVAAAAGVDYCTVRDILAVAKDKGEDPFVIVLDGVTDPHNLGSIIRSAECAGAHGVIIGKRRSASVTAAAVKAAAGATEYVKIARVTNLSGALSELKKAGLWIAGADMTGTPMTKQGLNGPLALVIGSEGEGLAHLVKETCDFLVSIPLLGKIESLNASVAAAVLMYEKKRQDTAE